MFAQQMRIKLIEDRTNFYTKKNTERKIVDKKKKKICNAHLLCFCFHSVHILCTFES